MDALRKHLNSKISQGKETLEAQEVTIMGLRHRILELESDRYLVGVARKCGQY